jgi:NADP-dependent 3-hydroxy acid dehydrogenase YdfG
VRVAIVTGASSGIGAATAMALAKREFAVVLVGRSEDALEDLRAKIHLVGGEILVTPADVRDRSQVKRVVDLALERLGRIDLLVNNAGVMPASFFRNLHETEWHEMVDVNVKGVLNCVGAVLPTMIAQRGGHIINLSSTAVHDLIPTAAIYTGCKLAVEAITEGLRKELSDQYGIRATVIRPGPTRTNLVARITDREANAWFRSVVEDLRVMDAEDVANAIVYAACQPAELTVSDLTLRPTRNTWFL